MNCHNGEKFLSEAINSILNQSYKNWELIFWDNCSTDNSPLILKQFKDHRIKYFKSDLFTSLGEARQFAFEKCLGEYVAFLDTDDIWYNNKLEKQIEKFERNVGIVTCNTLFFNDKIKKPLYQNKIKEGHVFKNLLENYNLSLETLIFSKKVANDFNICFDKNLSYISDFDFFLRLSKVCELRYVPEILCGWRVHNDSESWKKPNRFNEEKQLFIKKIESSYLDLIQGNEILWKNFKVQTLKKIAVYFIINNKPKRARLEISDNFIFNFQVLIIYFLSFLFISKYFLALIIRLRKKVKPN